MWIRNLAILVKFLSGENPLVESEMNFSIDRGKRWRHVSEAQAAKAVKQVILFFICLSKALAIRWLLGAARKRPGRNMAFKWKEDLAFPSCSEQHRIWKDCKEEMVEVQRECFVSTPKLIWIVLTSREERTKWRKKKIFDKSAYLFLFLYPGPRSGHCSFIAQRWKTSLTRAESFTAIFST